MANLSNETLVTISHFNMMLEQATAIAQAELQNSPLYVHRRERVKSLKQS